MARREKTCSLYACPNVHKLLSKYGKARVGRPASELISQTHKCYKNQKPSGKIRSARHAQSPYKLLSKYSKRTVRAAGGQWAIPNAQKLKNGGPSTWNNSRATPGYLPNPRNGPYETYLAQKPRACLCAYLHRWLALLDVFDRTLIKKKKRRNSKLVHGLSPTIIWTAIP